MAGELNVVQETAVMTEGEDCIGDWRQGADIDFLETSIDGDGWVRGRWLGGFALEKMSNV